MRRTLTDGLDVLASLVEAGGVAVLSGAGISTESGIPDYRGPTGKARDARPMLIEEFTGTPEARQRYWARSHLGWQHITTAQPNDGHRAVAELQRTGLIAGVITQNVDGLHEAAGSAAVIDLHGRLDRVICLDCREVSSRWSLDQRLRAANAHWGAASVTMKPDGDAAVSAEDITTFVISDCASCGGILKPDVVFFGENAPRPRVAASYATVEAADALLVLGSSLTVASGYRFVRHASKLGRTIAIVNQGPTRGDALADLVVDAPLGRTLRSLVGLSASR
jgi:NAD-dependent SIR2 family protein deacetylase